MTTVLDRVVATVSTGKDRGTVENERQAWGEVLKELKGCERNAIEKTNQRILELDRQLYSIDYPEISLEVLRWRNSAGFPLLALFELDGDGMFSVSNYDYVKRDGWYCVHPFTGSWDRYYHDVANRLQGRWGRRDREIRAVYEGVMPLEVRRRLDGVKDRFEKIYIMTEVEKWDVHKVVRPLIDPLVVGRYLNAMYLIDRYDTTDLEEYIRKEFAV